MRFPFVQIICCLLMLLGLHADTCNTAQAADGEKTVQGILVFVRPSGIWIHNLADGKETKIISDTGCASPQISPSCDRIVFTSKRDRYASSPQKGYLNGQVYIFDRNTGRTARLVTCPQSDCANPIWSPDEKEVAFERVNYKEIVKKEQEMIDYRTEICIADAKTGKVRIAARGVLGYEWQDCTDPIFFDSGRKLVYFYNEPGVREPRILSFPEGKKIETVKVLKDLAKRSECCFLAFSKDGRYLALTEIASQSIYLMNRSSGEIKELVPFKEQMGSTAILHSFSPDGSHILCSIPVTDEESRIFIVSLGGNVAREIKKGLDPCWGPR